MNAWLLSCDHTAELTELERELDADGKLLELPSRLRLCQTCRLPREVVALAGRPDLLVVPDLAP